MGSGASDAVGRPVTLEELEALNAEIAALVRAGVPLGGALGQLGRDLPGRLGRLAELIGRRLETGQSLDAVFSDRQLGLPPVYQAVVRAGLRGGRLSAALESVARSVRHLMAVQRMAVSGLVYPVILFLLAWGLFLAFFSQLVPRLAAAYRVLMLEPAPVFDVLAAMRGSLVYWGPAVPAVVLSLVAVWWVRCGRGSMIEPGSAARAFGWLPWMGPMLRSLHAGAFSEVLLSLVENEVPLDEGIRLAAQAVGDRGMMRSADQMALGLQRGQVNWQAGPRRSGFPPLLEWLLKSGASRGLLVPALRHSAQTYRDRAHWYGELARMYLPILFIVLIGGLVTLGYALLMFFPWVRFLSALG
ncbi:MAG TPA: hypothetical protein EYP56_22540 [Planctomycetaceae bacterium]|nr:hypothetical protein [Planctomycetaceae bacterium]